MEWLIIAALVLFGLSEWPKDGGPPAAPGADADRWKELRDRAATGAPWAGDFADALQRAGVPFPMSTTIAMALARWAGIESGGDAMDRTTSADLDERGLLQATKEALLKGGGSEADWEAILHETTPRARQADIMISYLKGLLPRVMELTDWGAANYPDLIWATYVYHALPSILVEMHDQKVIGSDAPHTSAAWKIGAEGGSGYKASDRLIKYGKPPTAIGLYQRFGIAANIVADG